MTTSPSTTEVQRVLDNIDQGKVATIKQHFDIRDTNSIISFGAKAQSKISEFSSQCIGQIKSKDTGYVGEELTELLMNVKDTDIVTGKQIGRAHV